MSKPPFKIEITDQTVFHCFKLTINLKAGPDDDESMPIEIMLHAVQLMALIRICSETLCKWQSLATVDLLQRQTGMTEDELRAKGIIA